MPLLHYTWRWKSRNILHCFIVKGILFNSETNTGDIALFLTPLGEKILDQLIEVSSYVKIRNESLTKAAEGIKKLKEESSIYELLIHDYADINQQLNIIKKCNETLRNSGLIKMLNPDTRPVLDPSPDCPQEQGEARGMNDIMERYGEQPVNPEYYGEILVGGENSYAAGFCNESTGEIDLRMESVELKAQVFEAMPHHVINDGGDEDGGPQQCDEQCEDRGN
jgi:hypothetical protein